MGELETISNIFKGYELIEKDISKNNDYASTLEIEFIKNVTEEFFTAISIEKWNNFIEILKNIKKRRGNKGLKFKVTISDYIEDIRNEKSPEKAMPTQEEKMDIEQNEIELLYCKRIIFVLLNKRDSDFIKGLERIEIAIENLTEAFNKVFRSLSHHKEMNIKENKKIEFEKIENHQLVLIDQIKLFIFLFDSEKRIWRNI